DAAGRRRVAARGQPPAPGARAGDDGGRRTGAQPLPAPTDVMSGLVPLRRADPSCGTKAATLGRLAEAGFAVPDGIVVRDPAVESWAADLPAALDRLGGARYAVRSSAIGEDSPHASFAGQHLTVLDVPAADVPARVVEV